MRFFAPIALGVFLSAAAAVAQPISVTGVDCSRLVAHKPAPDVAYQPGVDARGRPVAPADLNAGPQIKAPETVVFDVAADLRRFGIPSTSPLFQPNVKIGTVRVERDGRVFFNDQPLQNPEIEALAEACRRRLPGGR